MSKAISYNSAMIKSVVKHRYRDRFFYEIMLQKNKIKFVIEKYHNKWG